MVMDECERKVGKRRLKLSIRNLEVTDGKTVSRNSNFRATCGFAIGNTPLFAQAAKDGAPEECACCPMAMDECERKVGKRRLKLSIRNLEVADGKTLS